MVRDKLKKVNIKVILLVLFGFGLIFIGVGSLNIKLGASKVNSSKKFASGDSFITELSSSSPSVVAGDSVTLTVKLLNININSGDKGIGVLSFKLDYDSDVFSLTSSSSDVGKISTNNNGDYIIVMNDGKVLTADTTVFTFTLKSKSNVNNVNSLISLSNILGSAGSSVSSKNTSLTVLVKDEGAPRVTFDVKNPNAYAKSHSATISVVDSDLDNSSLKYQWVQGNTKPSEASFTDTFTNNQTITKDGLTGNNWYLWVLAKDTKKNTSIVRSEAFYFDNTAPTCNITSDGSNLIVNGSDSQSGLDTLPYSFDNINFTNVNKKSISSNGTYKAYVRDKVGNVAECSYVVNVTAPTIAISNSQTLPTKSLNVTINALKGAYELDTNNTYQYYLSSSSTMLTDGEWTNYQSGESFTIGAKKDGIYYLFVKAITDTASNKSTDSFNDTFVIDNVTYHRFGPYIFDNTSPSCSITSSTSKYTNTNLVLTVTGNDENGLSDAAYSFDGVNFSHNYQKTVSENGKYSAYVKDYAGNVNSCSIDVNNIDKDRPVINIKNNGSLQYSKTHSSEVVVNDIKLAENGLKYQWTTDTVQPDLSSFTTLFTNNTTISKSSYSGDYYLWIYAIDEAGNYTVARSEVFKFDNTLPTAPTISANIKNGETAESDVLLQIDSSTALSGIKKYQYSLNNGVSFIDYDSSKKITFTEEGEYSVIARAVSNVDINGVNSKSFSFKIKHSPMALTMKKSTSLPTNKDVVVTITSSTKLLPLSGFSLSSDGYSLSKSYSENTTGDKVVVTDIYGNSETQTIVISNIDKEKPTIKGVMNNGVYGSIKLEFNKNVKTIKVVKNGALQEYKRGDVINSPGDYVITIIDEVGNSSTYNISLRKNGELVSVPDTSSNYSKLFIVVGVLEVIVGILLFSQVGLKGKVNLSLILLVILVAKFSNNSMAASTTAIDLNGYEIKDNYLLNVEASTSYSNMKSNLFDKSVTVKRSDSELSSSSYVGTGDLLTYGSDNYRVIIKGDITGDGSVDYNDYGKLILVLLSKSNFNEYEAKAADYNVDEVIDISDLYYINKRLNSTYVIKPKGIRVVSANTKLKASSSTKIVAQVYPVNVSDDTYDSRVVYGNSVSVSNNTVKGIDAGNAIVLVSSNANPALNTTLTFEIESIPVTGVSLSKDSATINIEESNSTSITPTISPSNATNKNVVYSSSNSSVAKVSSTGKITGVFPGVAVITVKSAEDSSKKATIKVLVQNDGKNYVNVNSATRSLYTQYVVSAHPSTIIQGFDISKNYIFTVQNLYSTSTDMNTNSLFINKHPRPGVSGSDSNMSLYGFGHGTNIAFEWANSKYNDTSDAYMWLAGGHYTWNNDNSKFSFDVTRDGAFPTRLAYHDNSTYTSNSVSFDTRSSVSRNDIKLYNGKNYSTTALSSKYYNIYKFYKTRSNEQVAIDTTNNLFIIRVTGSSGQIFSIYKLTDIKNSSVDYIDGNIPKLATFTIPKTPLDFQGFDIAGDYVYVYYGESNRNGTQNSQGYVAMYDFLGNEKFNKKVYSTSTSIFEEPEGIKVYKESGKYVAYLGSSLVSGSQKYVKICTFK